MSWRSVAFLKGEIMPEIYRRLLWMVVAINVIVLLTILWKGYSCSR